MTQQTIKGYIVHMTWHGEKGDFVFQPYKAVKSCEHYIQVDVCPHEITFEVPAEFDPRTDQVAALRAVQEKARADFTVRMTALEHQIGELLALESS